MSTIRPTPKSELCVILWVWTHLCKLFSITNVVLDLSRWSSWGIFRGLRPLNPTRTITREWVPSSTPAEIHLKVRVTVNSARGLPVRQKDPLKYGLHLTCMKTPLFSRWVCLLEVTTRKHVQLLVFVLKEELFQKCILLWAACNYQQGNLLRGRSCSSGKRVFQSIWHRATHWFPNMASNIYIYSEQIQNDHR